MNIYVTVDLEKKWHRLYDLFYCLISADQMCFPLRKHTAEELIFLHADSWILNNWTRFILSAPLGSYLRFLEL